MECKPTRETSTLQSPDEIARRRERAEREEAKLSQISERVVGILKELLTSLKVPKASNNNC